MYKIGLTPFTLVALISQPLTPSADSAVSRVQRQELVRILDLTGDLKALETVQVTSPNLESKWSFLLSYLVPEGTLVDPGDLLAQFDEGELTSQRLELEKKKEDARIQIAQRRAAREIEKLDLLLNLAGMEKSYGVAKLYADIDPQLLARSEAEKYRFEVNQARLEMKKANERVQSLDVSARADLNVVQLEFDQAELELRRVLGAIEQMTVRADSRGIVLYLNRNDGEKVQVGDSFYRGFPLLELPDMNRLAVATRVFDTDFNLLHDGVEAEIAFDAIPSRSFGGRLSRRTEIAKPIHRGSELKVFEVEFELLEKDPDLMKPGMTARVRVLVPHGRGLVVDRAAVRVDGAGHTYLLSESGDRISCRVVETNHRQALIEGDVREGDVVVLDRPRVNEAARGAVWMKMERRDIHFAVSGTGELRAAQSVRFRPPAIPHTWDFKIIQMAPEGEMVEPGETILSFDPSQVLKTIQYEQAELEKVERELEKTEARLQLQHQDLKLELEQAGTEDEKAANKLAQARQFGSNLNVRRAELEAGLAHRRVELLGRKLTATEKASALQLQILRETHRLHEHRIESANEALERLELKAPIPGLVVYVANWNNEKKTVGSDVYFHETVVALPTLSTLMIQGRIAESDAGKVRMGQQVSISFDAVPEKTYQGRIARVGSIFRQPLNSRPLKVLDIEVELDEIDLQRMRPEMAARLKINVDEFQNALAVPLAAVEIQQGKSFVWVRGEGGTPVRRAVRLGKDNGIVAVVESGLEEGESILGRRPEEAD